MLVIDRDAREILDTETGAFWRYCGGDTNMVVFLGAGAKAPFARGTIQDIRDAINRFLFQAIRDAFAVFPTDLVRAVSLAADRGHRVDTDTGRIHESGTTMILRRGSRAVPLGTVVPPHLDDEFWVDIQPDSPHN